MCHNSWPMSSLITSGAGRDGLLFVPWYAVEVPVELVQINAGLPREPVFDPGLVSGQELADDSEGRLSEPFPML